MAHEEKTREENCKKDKQHGGRSDHKSREIVHDAIPLPRH